MKEQDIAIHAGILKLVQETFTEQEVLDVALYIISSTAVGEAVEQGLAGRKEFIEGLPPQALDLVYKYESALTQNKFYLQNFSHIKSFVVMDKVKLSAGTNLVRLYQESKNVLPIEKLEHLLHSKLDSLAFVAFLWKGYDFAVEFMTKARVAMELSPIVQDFLKKAKES